MTKTESTPEELAHEAQRGSRRAFGELVERFQEPLYNFLILRTGNPSDAEELAQEAFLRAWRRIGSYDSRWRFSTWLFAVARNLAISLRRTSRSQLTLSAPLEDVSSTAEAPESDLSRTEERTLLWSLASRVLSDEQRDALWLRYAEDMPPLEIARVLERRPSTIRVLLFRARARLADHLQPAVLDAPRPPTVQVKIAGDPQ